MQRIIAGPLPDYWRIVPKSADEWRRLRDEAAARTLKLLPELRERFGIRTERQTIAGVDCYVLTSESIPEGNQNRLLMHLHGGYFVFNPGEAGTREGILMAGFGHFKVVSVDYRQPPDFPYPAGLDDALAVWKELVKTTKPTNVAVFGASAGGNLTLALVEGAKQERSRKDGVAAAADRSQHDQRTASRQSRRARA
jgi:monoterpene epsilon-lactone hydrolase